MLTLQERARILALKIERERREDVRKGGLPLRLRVSRSEVLDLMDGQEVDDSQHSATVWVGRSFGFAPAGPQAVRATRDDEALLIRDGRRRKAVTYTDARYPSGRIRNKNRRLAVGIARLAAMQPNPDGEVFETPERGFFPCPPVDTLAHGRSAMTMRIRNKLAERGWL